jgi:hypothetical protein
MNEQPKPAASLTAARIKRGALPVGIAAEPLPMVQPLSDNDSGGESAFAFPFWDDAARVSGFLTWRRAGLFGLVYVGALVAFASAFDVWSMLGL